MAADEARPVHRLPSRRLATDMVSRHDLKNGCGYDGRSFSLETVQTENPISVMRRLIPECPRH
jgi:hypothetical protein